MIADLHLYVGVITCGLIALILSFMLETPTSEPMDTVEQYVRSLRNLLINISVFSAIGWIPSVLINTLTENTMESVYFEMIWVLASVAVWWFWPRKLLITPPTNAIMRTTNIFHTGKRSIADNQGIVDNAIKYHGPVIGIINVFDKFQGFVETESRENLNIKIDQLRFKDDIGSGRIIGSYAVCDTDAYSANGDNEPLRVKKVTETLSARLKSLVEQRTAKKDVYDVMAEAYEMSKEMSAEFNQQNRLIEQRLGIRVQYLELTDINESDAHAEAYRAKGVTKELLLQAEDIIKQAKNEGLKVTMKTAMQFVSGWSGKAPLNIHMLEVDAKGLEKLNNLMLGGASAIIPKTGGK